MVNATGTRRRRRAGRRRDDRGRAGARARTLLGDDLAASVDTVIDATGKYVIPGGIDAHTHMELPFGGTDASDTFETGTRAAAWGGTTSIIDFAVQRYGERVEDGLAAWHEKAAGNCAIDYGFHQIIGGVDEFSLKAMDALIDEGITSFKLFMAYPGVFYSDDAQILKAMQKSAETGLLTMMHAENGPAIDVLAEQLVEAGQDRPVLPRHRPRLADGGGGHPPRDHDRRTSPAPRCTSCTSAPSRPSSRSPPRATRARTSSARPARSTCTSRWRSSSAPAARSGATSRAPSGSARRRCARGPRATRTHMWQALRTNDLQMVSTDHCPFCMKDQKELGRRRLPGDPQRHRLASSTGWTCMYQGVVTGQITLERWVELTSTTPARMFGLYGTKGVIQPGADADIVIYDPNGHTSIGVEQDPPHEHGPLGLGGLRDRRPRRLRAVARHGDRRRRRVRRHQGPRPFLKRDLSQYLICSWHRADGSGKS